MYVPDHFKLPDDQLQRLLSTARVGNLVTVHDDGPDATLLPFFFDASANQLVTHAMRINPQVTKPVTGPAMVVLDIADAYVSPRWYATNGVLPNVPTWDYITIHVWGEMHVDASDSAALAVAKELTEHFEPAGSLDEVGESKLLRMARSIVSVRVDAERVVGKAKMSQNRHPDDIRSLIEALDPSESELLGYLRDVSLPHAERRLGMIRDLRAGRTAG